MKDKCGVCGTDISNDTETGHIDEFGTVCVECGQLYAEYADDVNYPEWA